MAVGRSGIFFAPPHGPHTVDRPLDLTAPGLHDQPIDRALAADVLRGDGIELLPLLHAAGTVRRRFFGNTVSIHVLDNVQNGACPEDCGYCGQSRDSDAPIRPYKLKPVEEIVADAEAAQRQGAYRFCMALSGRGPDDRDIDHMARAIERITALGIRTCLSAGLLDEPKARRLQQAGLDRLNHNLNTSEARYPDICSTHTYADRLDTLRAARRAGLQLCSGVIVGMGEADEDLIELAYTLRDLRAESIPVNFLLPIAGNRIHQPRHAGQPLDPRFVLRTLCMFRLVNPGAEVRIAAGREAHLRSLQPLALYPANSLFMEGYLLTRGQQAADTIQMILDAGFTPRLDGEDWPDTLRQLAEGRPANDDTLHPAAHVTPDGLPLLKPTVMRT